MIEWVGGSMASELLGDGREDDDPCVHIEMSDQEARWAEVVGVSTSGDMVVVGLASWIGSATRGFVSAESGGLAKRQPTTEISTAR